MIRGNPMMMRRRLEAAGGSGPSDPNWANCVLALRCDGAHGSTGFSDVSNAAHAVTANGNAQVSTAQSFFYGSSLYLDGGGGYLSVPDSDDFHFSTDFTVRAKVTLSSLTTTRVFFEVGTPGWLSVYANSSGYVTMTVGPGPAVLLTGATALSTATWYDLECSRGGNTWRIFVDGVMRGTVSDGDSPANYTGQFRVGASVATGNSPWHGYINDFQVYNGICLHSADFTPPTDPFTAG